MEDNSDHVEQQTSSADYISCRYCLEVEGYLTEPKQLPCSHIYCLPCLSSDLMTNDIIRCPTCRYVTDISLDKLPTAVRGDNKLLCDVCVRDEVYDENSKVYCTECAIKFCHKHELMHEEILRSHDDKMIGIADYRLRARQLEVRKCTEHPQEMYRTACVVCFSTFCPECVYSSHACVNGRPHEFLPLSKFSPDLKNRLDELREEMRGKESKVSELVKSTEIVLSVWDSETEEMILLIRKTRDEQMKEIEEKYDKMEKQFLSHRTKAKDDITKYLDEKAGVKMAELKKEILKFDAKLRNLHQVDIVTHHSRLVKQVKDMIEEDFPSLVLADQYKLSNLDVLRQQTEIELIAAEDYIISLTDESCLPSKIELIREIEVPGGCITVCSYKGVTYVGLQDGRVVKINKQGQVKEFIKLEGAVSTVRVYKDRIYTLMCGGGNSPYTVFVHDLSGKTITSWKHSSRSKYYQGCKICFVKDQLVIIDAPAHYLTTYALCGKNILREQLCPNMIEDDISEVVICEAGGSSLIVSHRDWNQVFRINIETGVEEWIREDMIEEPQGVSRYGDRYLIVSNKESTKTKLWIQDIKTGNKLGEIIESSDRTNESTTYDLFIDGNTMIIPRYDENKVLFYKLD